MFKASVSFLSDPPPYSQVLVSWGHHLVVLTGADMGFWPTVYQWEHSNHGLPLHHLQCVSGHVYLHLPLCSAEKGKKAMMMDESMEKWVVVFYQGSETFNIKGAICDHFPPNLNSLWATKLNGRSTADIVYLYLCWITRKKLSFIH